MTYYQLVKDGVIASDPQPATRFKDKTQEQLAAEGWYLVVWDYPINDETQKYGEPTIDNGAKTVSYATLQKSPEEIEQYHQEIIAQKVDRLWRAAYAYEFAQISGSAVGMLTALVMAKNSKGVAVQNWVRSIWNTYYARKNAQQNDWASQQNESYYDLGNIPHTIPELIAEYDILLGAQ